MIPSPKQRMLLLNLETLFETKGKSVTGGKLYSVPECTIFCPLNREYLLKTKQNKKKKRKSSNKGNKSTNIIQHQSSSVWHLERQQDQLLSSGFSLSSHNIF